ncbi:hypothetical protein GWI33_003964 [Rhynchophorus ferrugineus]|uniref:Uncharacterized protein n=1 Tax=Rhynchophorus ferrugineus TaxID=354439 RepID=A0A834HQY4_RHYFE|nr:hypothetical protein GWI33_003964 [Rhynchophorus ferrugineus]
MDQKQFHCQTCTYHIHSGYASADRYLDDRSAYSNAPQGRIRRMWNEMAANNKRRHCDEGVVSKTWTTFRLPGWPPFLL